MNSHRLTMLRVYRLIGAALAFCALLVSLTSARVLAQEENGSRDESLFKRLQWRAIGPANMGGRIDDFAVVESNPTTWYVGAATGGLWKTTNNGTTFEPIFDEQGSTSIGDVAIAPSDPNIIWVGAGESNNRQSSSWGDGVYRSLDGGKTWVNCGLRDTKHIGRVVIDPRDPNIVYVAATGHLWGPNKERGVFKTTDSGKTWANVLFVNEDTGATDIAIDPQSPLTLYAAMYQRRRTPWGFNGGGPASALYKTIDGGATWRKLTNGLPTESPIGRIGIDIYRANPSIVYAVIESAKGGTFRSEDRGETWKKMSDTNHRPMYYSQIRIDPNNDQRIWMCGAPMLVSEDGGKTFVQNLVTRIHGDYHALWIDPTNSSHMLAGSDGGIHQSYDRGRTWDHLNTIPLGQFYEISLDDQKPYMVYGGLQDNGSWAGPSGTLNTEGITNADWFRTGGGDGFYSVVDKKDPSIIYVESQNGNVARLELKTGERRNIKPVAPASEPEYRFDWNSPILISAFNDRSIYFGGNRVFHSTDRGDSWTRSDDLSKNEDRDKKPIMGVLPDKHMLSRHDGQETFGQVVTLAESPIKEGLLYAGTDDGNLQVSRDSGKTWKNLTGKVPGVPKNTYVSRVVPSRFAEGTVYVTFDGHRGDDYNSYVFVSTDFGDSWKAIRGDLPSGVTCRVIREHTRTQNLLFLGTEFGAYVSFDRGGHWTRLKGNLPMVRVDDIQIHPRDNDLVLGTHGRSVWVLDDLTPFEQMSDAVKNTDATLFDIQPGIHYRLYNRGSVTGHKLFTAPNPPYGAVINYYLKEKAKDDVKVKITDKSGKTVRELNGPKEAGLNRVVWDLRGAPPVPPERPAGEGEGGGGGGFGFGPRGMKAAPGDYTVTISVAGHQLSKTVRVEEDPRIQISDADRAQLAEAQSKVFAMQRAAGQARRSLQNLKAQLTTLQDSLKKTPGVSAEVNAAVKSVADQTDDLLKKLIGVPEAAGNAGPPLPDEPRPLQTRINGLFFGLESYTAAPTQDDARRLAEATAELKTFVDQVNKLLDESVAGLNKQMRDSGVAFINSGGRITLPPQ
ncbi:MAG TPA: hypothetical protein VKA60_23680 [Blastocatellia bacterium]|nr:hypothetical protein [Blastocatellia bacterium]